jgi:hypothetical protein
MIVSAKNNNLYLCRQQAFEALRQSHSGKTAAHNHNPFGKVWRDGFSFLHVQATVAIPTTRHSENFIFWTRKNEWGEYPMKFLELLNDRRLHFPTAAEGAVKLHDR